LLIQRPLFFLQELRKQSLYRSMHPSHKQVHLRLLLQKSFQSP